RFAFADVNQPCGGNVLCKTGLSCATIASFGDAGVTTYCLARSPAGGSCVAATPDQCPDDEYCQQPQVSAAGTCVARKAAGAACVTARECAPMHTCKPNVGGARLCMPWRDNGQSCDGAACFGDRCGKDGLCTDCP